MSALSVEAPYTIASLTKPFDRENGRIHASPVYTIDGSRKRKRHEIAAAIDGEALNIYNIRSQSLTTSYALPPQTFLCCEPCSNYRRTPSAGAGERQTYLVVKESSSSLKRRLLCFTEKVRSKRKDAEFSTPVKSQYDLHEGQITGLDVVPGASSQSYSLIVSYVNGDIHMVTDDLSKGHYQPAPEAIDALGYRVEYASVLDFNNATKGLLKGREDVVAQLNADVSKSVEHHLLCRIVQTAQQKRLELYTLRDTLLTELRTTQGALQLIMDYDLTFAAKPSASSTRYELNAASGTLYQLRKGKLSIIDLSSTTPKLVTRIGSSVERINTFCRVSASSVLTFTHDKATLLDTSFGSVQASVLISASSTLGPDSRKRKRIDDGDETPSFDAICAYIDIGSVIGIAGQELKAVQLNGSVQRSKSSRATGTLLRDAKSNEVMRATGGQERDEKKKKNWERWVTEVDRLVDVDDMEGLENLVSNDKEFGRQRKVGKNLEAGHSSNADDVDAITYADLWPLPEAFDPQDVEKRKALYLLSKVFNFGDGDRESIHIRIPSFKLLELFALSGLLSTSYLKSVLAQDVGRSLEFVRPGAIMSAINDIDDDFQLMHDLLSLPVALEPADIMQALRTVIQSFDTSAEQDAPLALPAPRPNGAFTNGESALEDVDEESEVELESKALEIELDFVVNALNSGLEIRSETIWEITRRLSLLPRKTVISLMRSMMPQGEIVFFVHILRIELADGGWTSKYIEDGENDGQGRLVNSIGEEEQSSPNNQAIQIIAHLLSCAIDAIGTSGWLVGLSSSALGTDEIIESLRAEISAGLEGCYEAHTLRTLLTELEGRAVTLEKKHHRNAMGNEMEVDETDSELSVLPFGSAAENMVRGARNGRGGLKTKKSVRMERSRKVGAYAFERIRI